jgi:uncharacterized membrane protein YfcA
MINDPTLLFLIFLSGLAAGFVNVYAGGGTILVIALLVFHGVPVSVANGTNRIGVLAGTGAATVTFLKNKVISAKTALQLGIWSIPGSILGALFSVNINNEIFTKILAVIVIFIAVSLFIPNKNGENSKQFHPVIMAISMFIVGLYGGFIQTGVGLIQIAVFKHIGKMNLLQTNAYKMANNLIFTIPAVIIFAFTDSILIDCAIAVAAGSIIGAKVGSALAIKNGEKFIRIMMFVILMAISAMFFIRH